jgi:heme exporter protein D
MRWETWSDFWLMGGYGLYVWGSMGMTAVLLFLEMVQAHLAHRRALALARAEKALENP